MTTIETQHAVADAPEAPATGESTAPASGSFFAGVADWVTTTDHKKIGRLYAGFGLVLLAGSAIVALLLGIERADDGWLVCDAKLARSAKPKALIQLGAYADQIQRMGLPLSILVVGAAVPLILWFWPF